MIHQKHKNLFLLFPYFLVLYEITNYLGNDMYLPALSAIAFDLNTHLHTAQLTLTTWFLGAASMQLVFGPLSDRFGRRLILLGGGWVFLLSTLVCAFSPHIEVLLIARFFQGSVVGSIVTAGYACIHETFPQKKAIQILAIMGSVVIIAPALGPLMGILILRDLSWRWIFGYLLMGALLTLPGLWLWMPESHPPEKRSALKWSVVRQNSLAILTNPRFLRLALINCATFLSMITWITVGPLIVLKILQRTTLDFALCQIVIFSSMIIGSQMVNKLVQKVEINTLITWGLGFILCGGVFGIASAWLFHQPLGGIIVGLALINFGYGLLSAPVQRLAMEACTEPMGALTAVFSTLICLSGAVAGVILSCIRSEDMLWSLGHLLFFCSLFAVLCWQSLMRLEWLATKSG